MQVHTSFDVREHGFHFANSFAWPRPLDRLLVGALGLCGGMCLEARTTWRAGFAAPLNVAAPDPGSPLYRRLFWRQIESLLRPPWLLTQLACWVWSGDGTLERRTARQVDRALAKLDRGTPVPLVLVVTRLGENPTRNHQVLAIGYERDAGAAELKLPLYDPNLPDEHIELLLGSTPSGVSVWHPRMGAVRGLIALG